MTVYRTSSANTYDTAIRNIGTRLTALSALQENLTSGKRVVRPSDDPTSAAIAERALTRISRIATDQRALASQKNAIAVAESTLGQVTNSLQRFRELVVSAGNGVHSAVERTAVALELKGLREHILDLANTKDTNGLPLFSALGSALQPFVGPQTTAPDYTFNGLPGQSASTAVSIPFALDGDSAFMLEPSRDAAYNVKNANPDTLLQAGPVSLVDASLITGSSYSISHLSVAVGTAPGTNAVSYQLTETPAGSAVPNAPVTITSADYPSTATTIPISLPGLSLTLTGTANLGDTLTIEPSPSVFSVMDDAIADIGSAANNAGSSQAVSQALHNIDISVARIAAVRGQAGELLNRAERISSNQESRDSQLKADHSRAEDLDMIQGLADFNNQESGYSAALQTYAQIQKLSLFNFIS